jgi:hypothetical protein
MYVALHVQQYVRTILIIKPTFSNSSSVVDMRVDYSSIDFDFFVPG